MAESAGGLRAGSHSEVKLNARKIGWTGRADLISIAQNACEILDFKTGRPCADDQFQVRLYALLWMLDDDANPDGLRADSLGIIYARGRMAVSVPTERELLSMKDDILARTRRAIKAVGTDSPAAETGRGFCVFCDVRQLCDPYWQSLHERGGSDSCVGSRLEDVEVVLLSRSGPRSWRGVVEAAITKDSGVQILVRNASRVGAVQRLLEHSSRVRVLRAALPQTARSGEEDTLVLNATSEVFSVC